MRVLALGVMAASLALALSACSGIEVIEAHQLKHDDFIQDAPFPALKPEIDKLIDPPPATKFDLADNMPNAPPGESINYGFTVLTVNHARGVGLRLHGTPPV